MPTLSYDGQSFLIDNRRVWIVAGTVCYAAMPRGLWRSRIRAAKQAGLNTIDVPIVWAAHEKSPKLPRFEGDADLRHFIDLVAQEGMWCILRVGPFVGGGWDFGGLPPWLCNADNVALRQVNGPFLEASSRFLTAVMDQVRDLQIVKPTGSKVTGTGPIIAFQIETDWFCHPPTNPTNSMTYLGELARYLRENGCSVPIVEANNLWEPVDGVLSTWKASEHLATDLRQLRAIQPELPRIVTLSLSPGVSTFGSDEAKRLDTATAECRLAQVIASGAQMRIEPFHGGTRLGFSAGRLRHTHDAFVTTSADDGAPLTEAGLRSDTYFAAKRLCMFASHFGNVLAHLEPDNVHVTASPVPDEHPLSIIHQRGAQGEVVFIIRDAKDKTAHVDLMLVDGRTLPVPLGDARVAWVLLNANLGGVAKLTYTNLRPWAFVDRKMLVLVGPAGAEGLIGIDDTPIIVKVPTNTTPHVQVHDPLTIVVLSEQQADAAYLHADALLVGTAGLGSLDQPLAAKGFSKVTAIRPSGEVGAIDAFKTKKQTAPKLNAWSQATLDAFVAGGSDSYKKIDGPADLAKLGAPYGYGWYKVTLKSAKAQRLLLPDARDRVHLFVDGKPAAIVGHGHGATLEPTNLKVPGDLVMLADNAGRPSGGWQLGEHKGVYGHAYEVKAHRLGKPQVTEGRSPNPFALGSFFVDLSAADNNPADALTWKFKPVGRQSVVFEIDGLPMRAMVFVNDEPRGLYGPVQCGGFARWTWHVGEEIKGGQNELRLALFGKLDRKLDVSKHVRMYLTSGNVTAKSDWAFAPWSMPGDELFTDGAKPTSGLPCWYRTTFAITGADEPLWFDPRGLSKGQLYLNGHNVGRYYVATARGRSIPPQKHYYLPDPWLRTDAPNVLTIFDEHGKDPGKARLVYGDR